MTEPRIKVRVFLAGPSDVKRELDVVRTIVDELNAGIADDKGLVLECVDWRSHVVPGMGRPEDVILRQIQPEDIFLGVMWSRIGTPTGKHDSGTVEEFELAYRLWLHSGGEDGGRPQILFYFNDKPVRLGTAGVLQQLERLLRFVDSVVERGLVSRYSNMKEFETNARRHLTTIVRKWRNEPREQVAAPGLRQTIAKGVIRPDNAVLAVADIEGFQLMNLELGSEVCDGICDSYQELARRCVIENGGSILRGEGDHVWALFDQAPRALDASLRILREIRDETIDLASYDLPVRMSLHKPRTWKSVGDVKSLYNEARLATALAKLTYGGHLVASGEFREELLGRNAPAGVIVSLDIDWHHHGWLEVAELKRRIDVWELIDVSTGATPKSLRAPLSSVVTLGRLMES